MSTVKQKIINDILAAEGGYVDDPKDSGGETNYGITAVVARENGYYGEMSMMPRDFAFTIYCSRYWDSLCADSLPEGVAAEVVDAGVNMGVSRAAKFLQRSLNVFNKQGSLYNDIVVDGNVGPGTLSALTAFLEFRDELILIKALNCLQGAFYIELAERREKDESFVYGWLKNRVVINNA